MGADAAGEGEGEEVDNDDGDAEVGEAPAAALDGFPPFFFVMVGCLGVSSQLTSSSKG